MYQDKIDDYLRKNGFGVFCPKAVLFDMDGVLYDSMPNHARSWHQSMAGFGIDMPEAEAYKYEGMRGVETIKLKVREQLHREISDEEAQRMYAEKSRLFSLCPQAKIMDGVVELQRMIKGDGLKIVVVTGSGQHSLLEKLADDFRGLVSADLIVSSFDVSRGKPDPEPYLLGLERAGVQPWEALVVENAPLGVEAGAAAKVFTVAVNTGPIPPEVLTRSGADLVLPSMAALADAWGDIYSTFA